MEFVNFFYPEIRGFWIGFGSEFGGLPLIVSRRNVGGSILLAFEGVSELLPARKRVAIHDLPPARRYFQQQAPIGV